MDCGRRGRKEYQEVVGSAIQSCLRERKDDNEKSTTDRISSLQQAAKVSIYK